MALIQAIEELYGTFAAAAPKPASMTGCPCCQDPAELCRLLQQPLRSLTADDLADYAASVFLTVGDALDFRYFLPRLLEIGAAEPAWWPSPEVLIPKLKLAHWETWARPEREAVMRVLDAWFEDLLHTPTVEVDPDWPVFHWEGDAVLCGLARAGIDLNPYLERLLDPAAAPLLRALYWMNFDGKRGRAKLQNAFWSDDRVAGAQLLAFLERSDVETLAAIQA